MPIGQANRLMPTLRRVVLARQSAARSDGELLGAFVVERDADAFAELVRRHGPMVLGVCRRVTGERATADDAFQAAFLVLARRAASVRPREQVGNFLYGVAYRTALKARMVLARRRSREKQVDVMPEPTAPAARPAWTDLQPVIDEELAKLPDKLRLPVVLCDLEGRSQREVAKHLSVPPATLATRLTTARKTLAARLTRRGVTLSGGALAGLLGVHASAAAVPPALALGVVRAGEAVAAGAVLDSLVSATAVQLSEGVMRMMMLAKLKAVAVSAVTALVLTTGLGLGLVPAAADDGAVPRASAGAADAPARVAAPAPRAKGAAPADPNIDDATFLQRLTMDVRGTPPTDVETFFFVSDTDEDKRAKVVEWVTSDEAVKAFIAKKLGVPADRIKLVRARLSADGKFVEVKLEAVQERVGVPVQIAFAPDGNRLVEGRFVETIDAGGRLREQKARERFVVRTGTETGQEKDALVVWNEVFVADYKAGKKEADTYQIVIGTDDLKPDAWVEAVNEVFAVFDLHADSDAEFLKRVLTDVRGTGPTALETKYFTEDKDPKKREKLLDTLLKDPAVQKKLGDAWKAKMLAGPTRGTVVVDDRIIVRQPEPKPKPEVIVRPRITVTPPVPPVPVVPTVPVVPQPQPPKGPQQPQQPKGSQPPVTKPVEGVPHAVPQTDRLEKLVTELIAAKKTDEAVLEAITLATLGRLPTDSEKKLALAGVGKAADRKAAWVAVARALAGPDDKGPPVKVKVAVEPPKPPAVPPAKP